MPNRNNIVTETEARIDRLLSGKAAEVKKIDVKIEEARASKDKADAALRAAIEATDSKAYTAAKKDQGEAESAIEMYMARRNQLSTMQYVTEEESDATINALKGYQAERAEEFRAALSGQVVALEKLFEEYSHDHYTALQTAAKWSQSIRANHVNPNRTYKDGSHRSPEAVPVSVVMLRECAEAELLHVFLDGYKRINSKS